MKKKLEDFFGCELKIAKYEKRLPLPIFMTMREIYMVEMYGVSFAIINITKEAELSVCQLNNSNFVVR